MAAPLKLSHRETKNFWEIAILHEDDALLCIDKPANLPVQMEGPEPGGPELMALLHEAIAAGKPWAAERNIGFLKNLHRMDAEASGVLVLAKTQAAQQCLANAFGSGQVVRRYRAIVQGNPIQERFTIDVKIGPDLTRPGMMRADPRGGKKCKTDCEVIESFSRWTLLACMPDVDRSHQVRVHLRYAKHSIAGDPAYRATPLLLSNLKPGFRLKPNEVERPLMTRPALHLESITLAHPVTGESLTVKAPLPKDFSVALKYLRKYGQPGLTENSAEQVISP